MEARALKTEMKNKEIKDKWYKKNYMFVKYKRRIFKERK